MVMLLGASSCILSSGEVVLAEQETALWQHGQDALWLRHASSVNMGHKHRYRVMLGYNTKVSVPVGSATPGEPCIATDQVHCFCVEGNSGEEGHRSGITPSSQS